MIALLFLAMPICIITGMIIEWRTGTMDHWIRHFTRPKFPPPQPILHEQFIDDCEMFNRAMIQTPLMHRVFEAPETLQ